MGTLEMEVGQELTSVLPTGEGKSKQPQRTVSKLTVGIDKKKVELVNVNFNFLAVQICVVKICLYIFFKKVYFPSFLMGTHVK